MNFQTWRLSTACAPRISDHPCVRSHLTFRAGSQPGRYRLDLRSVFVGPDASHFPSHAWKAPWVEFAFCTLNDIFVTLVDIAEISQNDGKFFPVMTLSVSILHQYDFQDYIFSIKLQKFNIFQCPKFSEQYQHFALGSCEIRSCSHSDLRRYQP